NGHPGTHKRKERSREAARCRRNQENELFKALARLLPLHPEIAPQLDKASIIRLVVSYVKLKTFLGEMNHIYMSAECDDRSNSTYECGNSTVMDWMLSELLQKICLQIKMAYSEDYKICWYLGIAVILQPIRVSELSTSCHTYVLRLTDDLCIQYIENSHYQQTQLSWSLLSSWMRAPRRTKSTVRDIVRHGPAPPLMALVHPTQCLQCIVPVSNVQLPTPTPQIIGLGNLAVSQLLCHLLVAWPPASEITSLPVMLHKTLYQHVDPFELNNLRSSHLESELETRGFSPMFKLHFPKHSMEATFPF
ncbi:hypothetical protein T265_14934, partial [Opisthorchis viverrini]